MLKLNKLFTDCAGLGFVLVMGRCGKGLLAHGEHKSAWVVAAIIALYTILFHSARKRA